jgi:hypothetical protein
MSRIDEALKRLAGVPSPEPQPPSVLERFAPEDKAPTIDDVKLETRKVPRADVRKVAPFVAAGPHPVEVRSVTPNIHVEPPAPRRPERPPVDAALEQDGEGEQLVDVGLITDYAGFVFRSVGRHKLLAAAVLLVALMLTVAGALLLPKTYYVQVKLLAQRNAVMNALSNPGRAVPWDADAPTRAAAETVLRRDNLVALITETDLVNEWDRRRAPIMKARDWLRTLLTRSRPTEDDKLDALVWQLENRMIVSAGPIGDGTVTIELFWPDGEMAYRLVERARVAFLDARQIAERNAIEESISILERYSASLHDDVNRTFGELEAMTARERAKTEGPRAPRVVTRVPRVVSTDPLAAFGALATESIPLPDPDVTRLRNDLTAKRAELSRLEQARQGQMSELQGRLSAAQTVYTTSHPTVVSLQQNLAAFQHESPQVVALKSEVEELEAKFDELSAADADRLIQGELSRRAAATPPPVRTTIHEAPPPQVSEQPAPAIHRNEANQFATLRLRTELNQLQSIVERTDGAKIELAVSEAAFKYRYTVIKPAQVPREPYSPNLRLVLLAGILASIVLALGAVVGADLMSHSILEAWQVKRQLGLPILGTVRMV